MTRRCCYCKSATKLPVLIPKNNTVRSLWLKPLRLSENDLIGEKSYLCPTHFRPTDRLKTTTQNTLVRAGSISVVTMIRPIENWPVQEIDRNTALKRGLLDHFTH